MFRNMKFTIEQITQKLSITVECSSLSLQGINDIHGCDCSSLGVLCVCDRVSNDLLKELLQNTSCLLIDASVDSLDASSSGESSDGWLCDALQDIGILLLVDSLSAL